MLSWHCQVAVVPNTQAIESVSRETGRNMTPTQGGREQGRGGVARSSGRSSRDPSNSRVCWNRDEVTNYHFANTCPKPQKRRDDPNRSVPPYPRERSASKEQGGATQGSETYRMLKGFYGKNP